MMSYKNAKRRTKNLLTCEYSVNLKSNFLAEVKRIWLQWCTITGSDPYTCLFLACAVIPCSTAVCSKNVNWTCLAIHTRNSNIWHSILL